MKLCPNCSDPEQKPPLWVWHYDHCPNETECCCKCTHLVNVQSVVRDGNSKSVEVTRKACAMPLLVYKEQVVVLDNEHGICEMFTPIDPTDSNPTDDQ